MRPLVLFGSLGTNKGHNQSESMAPDDSYCVGSSVVDDQLRPFPLATPPVGQCGDGLSGTPSWS